MKKLIKSMSKFQSGLIYHYILMMIIAIVLIYLRFNLPHFDTITLPFISVVLLAYFNRILKKRTMLERQAQKDEFHHIFKFYRTQKKKNWRRMDNIRELEKRKILYNIDNNQDNFKYNVAIPFWKVMSTDYNRKKDKRRIKSSK